MSNPLQRYANQTQIKSNAPMSDALDRGFKAARKKKAKQPKGPASSGINIAAAPKFKPTV